MRVDVTDVLDLEFRGVDGVVKSSGPAWCIPGTLDEGIVGRGASTVASRDDGRQLNAGVVERGVA